MLRRLSFIRSLLFSLFAFVPCLPSTALLPQTRGSETSSTLLWKVVPTTEHDVANVDQCISDINQIPSKCRTRQWFLSSVSSTCAVLATTAQLASATEPNTSDRSGDASASTSDPKSWARELSITLRSLPVSGCWAAAVTVSKNLDSDDDSDFFSYLAVVDTGSPFLTAPMNAFEKTEPLSRATKKTKKTKRDSSDMNDSESSVSYEQYGTTIGSVEWRKAPYVTLIGNGEVENIQNEPVIIQDQNDVVLGIPSAEVVEETGGIFLGLMTVDSARPTPLQQLGYDAFIMRFRENLDEKRGVVWAKTDAIDSESQAKLILWDGKYGDATNGKQPTTNSLIDRFDPSSMKLFDFTSYGPNIHHYGVLCDRFECRWDGDDEIDLISFDCSFANGTNSCAPTRAAMPGISLSRPLVAVFDTGLSGCIFSDTLWEEIQVERLRRKQLQRPKSSLDVELSGLNSEAAPPPIGCNVWLPTTGHHQASSQAKFSSSPTSVVKLSSVAEYWRFQSFRLPWWYDNHEIGENDGTSQARSSNYPHVVVLGSTFWRNPNVLDLAVDTTSERAKITTRLSRR